MEPARTQVVIEQLRTIPRAVVHEVLGPYDIVVELETDTPEDITAILRQKIRTIRGVTNTVTCPWIN
ncbi:MAG: Lrp/AsnC ligand binding domain-containing protein [Chloroflexi bacterium]|nr:Lrp/AsnC ligand binding domain-containing protein [Chloroflexota bacterium]